VTTPVPAPQTFGLDLAAFEGPFDLLLTLVLKEELELSDVDIADIVTTFVEQLTEAADPQIDAQRHLEAAGEFLVLVASLLELKARELFPDGTPPDLADLDPALAAAELAERLEAYRRIKSAAQWLGERLEKESDRFFRLGPPPLAPEQKRELPRQDPAGLADALRRLAAEPPAVSLAHMPLKMPPVGVFVERFRSLIERRRRFVFDEEVVDLSRIEQAVALLAILELGRGGAVRIGQADHCGPIVVWKGAA